jgi:PAS domain S-box-containing protein
MANPVAAEISQDGFEQLGRAIALETSGAHLPDVVEALLLSARAHAGPHASASLFLVDEGSGQLELVAPGTAGDYAKYLFNTPIATCTAPCGRAALRGEQFIVGDVSSDARCAGHLELANRYRIRSCWSFPIRARQDHVLGALALCFHAPQPAEPRLMRVMELLARLAGLTVQRHRDAEERARAEAKLRNSESRYRSLTSSLTAIVWTTDAQARFTAPQESWRQYTGQSWEQQRDHGWFQAVHPDDKERVLGEMLRALQERDFYRADGRVWHQATQNYRYCEARGMPVLGDDGNAVEWVGTCVDVDDYKRAEEALRLADRRKDEYMAVLAHELRNSLAPLGNAVHILKARGLDNAQFLSARTVIERQVSQMSRLLEDLLDISRITRNKLELRKTRVALESVLEASLETSRPVLEQHGHEFEMKVLTGSLYVEADAARLAQVFSNLLNNAAKYTNRGGAVSVTVRGEGNDAVVAVKDNGIGIEPEMLPRLFHMFSQAGPAIERSPQGLGIGLALVRGLVELHGGSVTAHSRGAGHGSEFVVHIPLASGGAALAQPGKTSAPVAVPMKILVADDNSDAAQTLSVLLRLMGHDVRTAANGHEAVEIAATFVPRLALLDIQMPNVDGYEAAARIRRLVPDARIVATTGLAQQHDVQKALASGFDYHLLKPLDQKQLADLILKIGSTLPPN